MTFKTKGPGTETNMNADYVISYRFAESDKSETLRQFEKFLQSLAAVGLSTEVRNGDKHSILVFVRFASDRHLYSEVYHSRLKDWLHGVRSSAPDKETEITNEKQQLYPAEKLRIVYQLLTSPVEEGGAGITPKHGEWKNVESIFALHNHEFNSGWLKKWATSYTLKAEDLDQIRNQFGEKVAFYFAFTQSYFTALIGNAAFGAASWLLLGYFSPIYAVVNSLLCVCFVEYWKKQEYDLAVRWGVRGVSAIENKRHDFLSEKEITDPVTGEKTQFFSGTKRLQRQLLQLPFAFLAAVVLGVLIATCFAIEIFISEIYSGPLQWILVFLPTGILTTVQPLLLGFLTDLAARLTSYENYETDQAFENAITQKIFVLNFLTSYLPIILTAFVYVPFAGSIVPYLDVFSIAVRPFADADHQMKTSDVGMFHINPSRLRKQVIYFTVTAQIVNQALEVVVPYFKRRGFSKYKEIQSRRAAAKNGGQDVTANDPPEESAFLKRVRKEAELDIYDVTTDFREMVVQYGYLTMFSVVWPPTAISFLINNWIELRTDAVKICIETQRPTPWRADSIGPWLDSLGFLTWLGSVTTAAIVYLFQGDTGTGEITDVGVGGKVSAWGLLAAILASEHVYFLVQWGVRTAIGKLDSPGRQKERAERYMVRKKYFEENMAGRVDLSRGNVAASLEKQEAITRRSLEEEARAGGSATMEQKFWLRQRDWRESAMVGKTLIEKSLADSDEGKKKQ